MTTRTLGQPHPSRRAAIALLAAVGVGIAAIGVAIAMTASFGSSSPASNESAAAVPATAPLVPGAPADQPLVVYMVGSAESRAALEVLLAEGEAIGAALGTAPRPFSLVIVPPGAEADFWSIQRDVDAMRTSFGMAPLAVLDLRTP